MVQAVVRLSSHKVFWNSVLLWLVSNENCKLLREYKAVYFSLEEILAFEVIYFLTLQDLTVIYYSSSHFCSEL
jgi:hypothetical protein